MPLIYSLTHVLFLTFFPLLRAREEQIPKANEIVEKLDPIIQATKLLQTKKTEDSIPTIVEMCNKLNSSQIIKILSLYTAGDEEVIPSTFMKKIQKFLVETRSDRKYLNFIFFTDSNSFGTHVHLSRLFSLLSHSSSKWTPAHGFAIQLRYYHSLQPE